MADKGPRPGMLSMACPRIATTGPLLLKVPLRGVGVIPEVLA